MATQTISIQDEQGNFQAEATRENTREPWTIRYETGEERRYGSESSIRTHIDKRLKEQAESEE